MPRRFRDRRRSVPGFGWNPQLSGLDRPREWAGFAATVMAALGIAMVIAFLAFG